MGNVVKISLAPLLFFILEKKQKKRPPFVQNEAKTLLCFEQRSKHDSGYPRLAPNRQSSQLVATKLPTVASL